MAGEIPLNSQHQAEVDKAKVEYGSSNAPWVTYDVSLFPEGTIGASLMTQSPLRGKIRPSAFFDLPVSLLTRPGEQFGSDNDTTVGEFLKSPIDQKNPTREDRKIYIAITRAMEKMRVSPYAQLLGDLYEITQSELPVEDEEALRNAVEKRLEQFSESREYYKYGPMVNLIKVAYGLNNGVRVGMATINRVFAGIYGTRDSKYRMMRALQLFITHESIEHYITVPPGSLAHFQFPNARVYGQLPEGCPMWLLEEKDPYRENNYTKVEEVSGEDSYHPKIKGVGGSSDDLGIFSQDGNGEFVEIGEEEGFWGGPSVQGENDFPEEDFLLGAEEEKYPLGDDFSLGEGDEEGKNWFDDLGNNTRRRPS